MKENIFIDMGHILNHKDGFTLGSLILFEECINKGLDILLLEDEENIFSQDRDLFVKKILSYKPKTISFSTRCDTYPMIINLAKRIKHINPQIKIILGGPHSSITYKETLNNFNCIDIINIGAGEGNFVKLLSSNFSEESLKIINNLIFRQGDKLIETEYKCYTGKIKSPIDAIKKYSLKYCNEIRLEAGRGCCFNCSFCVANKIWDRRFLLRDAKDIFKDVKNLNFKNVAISFVHDNLLSDRRLGEEFLDNLIKINEKKEIAWKCSCRVDLITHEIIDKLKLAGSLGVYLGIETASLKMQKIYNKHIDIKKAEATIKLLNKNNIRFVISLIIGHPRESLLDIYKSIAFAIKMRNLKECERIQFHKLAAITGSSIYQEYFKDLKFFLNNVSDQATTKLLKEDIDLIKDNKNIFSVFYSLPTKNLFINANLRDQAIGFEIMVNAFPKTSLFLLKHLKHNDFINSFIKKRFSVRNIEAMFFQCNGKNTNIHFKNFYKELLQYKTFIKPLKTQYGLNNTLYYKKISQRTYFVCWKNLKGEVLSMQLSPDLFLKYKKKLKDIKNLSAQEFEYFKNNNLFFCIA